MQVILKELGITEHNDGVSTGKNWISSKGKIIASFSPVVGKKIGEVICADEAA